MNPSKLGLRVLAVGVIALAGCGLEPDEIDFADGDTGADSTEGGATNTGNDGTDPTGDGDPGDGDPDTGDGDGDPGTGDGDGDPGDGDGDPGDGDGDPGTGDGDGDGDPGQPCEDLPADPLELGPNPVALANVMSSYSGSCEGDGPDALYSFQAPANGTFTFLLTSDEFEGRLYLVGPSCVPLQEITCGPEGMELQHMMIADEIVHVLVDSTVDPGAGVVTIGML